MKALWHRYKNVLLPLISLEIGLAIAVIVVAVSASRSAKALEVIGWLMLAFVALVAVGVALDRLIRVGRGNHD